MKLSPEQLVALRTVPLGRWPNRLALALQMAGVTQAAAAESIGIPRTNFNKIVNGRYEGLQLETSRKIADFFGCAIEDLFPARQAVA